MTLSLAERHRLALLGWLATFATSLSLYTSMQEKRFVVIGAALAALVVAIGMLLRQLRVPFLLVLLAQLVVGGWALLAAYPGHLWHGVVPTTTTFSGFHDLVSSGLDVAQRYAAPVPASTGLTMITVAFIMLVAIVVDQLAAGLGRAPLAGLPLLAMYAVPVASLPNGVPALGFIPGAAAYLALLIVFERERLSHWGRFVSRSSRRRGGESIDTSGLAVAGRRLSVLAIAVAVLLPLGIPTFTHTLFHGNGLGNGKGVGVSLGDPMASLAQALHRTTPVDLIDVASSAPPEYLRLAVLNKPGPDAWRISDIDLAATVPTESSLPPIGGLGDQVIRTPQSMSLLLTSSFPRSTRWLPVPYDVTSVGFSGYPGGFGYVIDDGTIVSTGTDDLDHVTTYSVSYGQPHFTVAQLQHATPPPASIVTRDEEVPAGVPEIVGEVADRVTAGLPTDYDKALALQSFFRDGHRFTYDLNAGYGDGYKAMAEFLRKRRGYCQHFALTMAMMARELGIPSRVVVGLLRPSRSSGMGGYVFTSADVHAWPELYFGGVGWVRFEPTPRGGAVPPAYTHAVTIPSIGPITPTQTSGNAAPGGGHFTSDAPTTPTQAPVQHRHHAGAANTGGLPSVWWLVLLILVVLLLSPGLIRWGIRRARLARAIDGGPSCEHAWIELRDSIRDLRLTWTGSLTPRARARFVEPLIGGDPDGIAALDRLSLTVERSRYSRSPLPDADPAADARAVLAAIRHEAGGRQRVLAFLWPASVMPEVRGSWTRWRARHSRPQPA